MARHPGFQIDEPIRFNPKTKKPHIAMEYFDSGKITDAWNLVRTLRPQFQRAVIGSTKGKPSDHRRGTRRGRQVDLSEGTTGAIPDTVGG